MDWHSLLTYLPLEGVAIWKARPASLFASKRACTIWNNRFPGAVAGSLHVDDTGHRTIHIKVAGKQYKAHRVFWEMVHGEIPQEMTIDHIDQDSTNNRIENLRLASQTDQHRNRPVQRNNFCGCAGVSWVGSKGMWRSRITVGRKTIELGMRCSLLDAIAIRKSAEINYGFHPNHGRQRRD
jgi:hypothetical protein